MIKVVLIVLAIVCVVSSGVGCFFGGTHSSYFNGYSDGREQKYMEGYEEGYNFGCYESFLKGKDAGYTDGHNEGYDVGHDSGYDDGHNDGYNAGYEQGSHSAMPLLGCFFMGYDAGWDACNCSD